MNKGLLGFPSLLKSDSFGSFPKKKVSNESFYTFPYQRDSYDFKVIITAANTVKGFQMTGIGSITIDWGDGTVETKINPGSSYSHTYTQAGTYYILLSGDTESLTYLGCGGSAFNGIFRDGRKFKRLQTFYCFNNSFAGQTFPDISSWTEIKNITGYVAGFSGELPSVSHCQYLTDYNLSYNNFNGLLPDFTNNTLLENLKVNNNSSLSGVWGSFNTLIKLKTFDCSNCNISGEFPSLQYCSLLTEAKLNNNKFSGAFPSVAANILLVTLYIYSNSFTSFSGVNGLTALIDFRANDNLFTGQFPSFDLCTALQTIFIGGAGNAWTGNVSYFPTSIKYIDIAGCTASSLIFPLDWLNANVNLERLSLLDTKLAAPQAIFSISNTKILALGIRWPYNANPQFTSGNIVFPAVSQSDMAISYLTGVSVDFSNILDATTASTNFSAENSGYNIAFPLGNKLRYLNNYLSSNAMSQANVDSCISSLFTYRNSYSLLAKNLSISGTNAAPSGTYQQPSGFTHDLTEAEITTLSSGWSVKEKVWVLVNCQISSADTTKRYKWTITMN